MKDCQANLSQPAQERIFRFPSQLTGVEDYESNAVNEKNEAKINKHSSSCEQEGHCLFLVQLLHSDLWRGILFISLFCTSGNIVMPKLSLLFIIRMQTCSSYECVSRSETKRLGLPQRIMALSCNSSGVH